MKKLTIILIMVFMIFAIPNAKAWDIFGDKEETTEEIEMTKEKTKTPVKTTQYGDWQLAEVTLPNGKKHKELTQSVSLKEKNQKLIQINFVYLADKKQYLAQLTLPLGIDLTKGTGIQLDDNSINNIVINTCTQRGCHATILLDDKVLNLFKTANKGHLAFIPNGGKQINIPFSLKGSSKGLDALK